MTKYATEKNNDIVKEHVHCNITYLFSQMPPEMVFTFDGLLDEKIYELWVVSDWLANKLQKKGEIVESDFYNLNVWGRKASGQYIGQDKVIKKIQEEHENQVR